MDFSSSYCPGEYSGPKESILLSSPLFLTNIYEDDEDVEKEWAED